MNFSCYQVNHQHRNQNSNKSQWIVATEVELQIFTEGLIMKWLNPSHNVIWSVPNHFSQLKPIGIERANRGSSQENLYIAKYTGDSNGTWHGYPVSAKSQHDHPPQDIVNSWISNSYIDKSFFSKWVRGKLK